MDRRARNQRQPPCVPEVSAEERSIRLAVCGCLVLAVALVFGQTLRHDFINFDDDVGVYNNPIVRSGLTTEALVAVFTQRHVETWCPLTCISHMVDWQFYRNWAGGHHLTNVLLHAGSAILLFLVLCRMTARVWASAMVAACFAVHPLHVESVAWVTERKDALGGLFFMLTLAAYVRYVQSPFSWARYLLVIGLFIVGLLAKPIVITLPFLFLVLDYWPLGRMKVAAAGDAAPPAGPPATLPGVLARLVLEKAPLLLLVALSCGLTIWGQADFPTAHEVFPMRWRLENACISGVSYIGQTLWPASLALPYPRRPLDLPIVPVLAALLALLGVTVAVFFCRRRFPYLLVGWLWYLGLLAPVLGIVQFGNQSEADRFTYLSQIGLCIALVWGLTDLCRSWPWRRWLYAVSAALVVSAMMACAWRQTSYWYNSETLWKHAQTIVPQNVTVYLDLGTYYLEQGQLDEAIRVLRQALVVKPDYHKTHNNLGLALARRGDIEAAIEQYRQAVEKLPDYPEANNNLANALAQRGQLDEAIVYYRRAVKSRPHYLKARFNLSVALARQGKVDEATDQLEAALKYNPYFADARRLLRAVRAQRDKMLDSLAGQRTVLDSHPDDVALLNDIAWTLATNPNASIRNGPEAVKWALRAARLAGDREPAVLDTLAAAYAEAGHFPDAVETAQKAVELAMRQNKAALADSLRARIKLYQAGSPYHKP
jgi:protein O-mannosyl-transferase